MPKSEDAKLTWDRKEVKRHPRECAILRPALNCGVLVGQGIFDSGLGRGLKVLEEGVASTSTSGPRVDL